VDVWTPSLSACRIHGDVELGETRRYINKFLSWILKKNFQAISSYQSMYLLLLANSDLSENVLFLHNSFLSRWYVSFRQHI
jgi:hypothetical protein